VGKAPPGYSDYSFAEQLKQLRKDLDEAVKSENFEVAADLRDKIKKLELQKREH
jgi:protein-arginine kinase activator protein McsA